MPSVKSVLVITLTSAVVVVGGGVAAAKMGPSGVARATVVKVVDGDTIDVAYGGDTHRVRLLNVDAPETKHPGKAVECLGREATRFLEERLSPGVRVRLEFDTELTDRYSRTLAGVFDGDVLINAEIARAGLGVPVVFEPNRKFYPPVLAAYEEAKAAEKGMFNPERECTFASRIDRYEQEVDAVERSFLVRSPEPVKAEAEEAVAAGAALLGLLALGEPGTLETAGLTGAELESLRRMVRELQWRAARVVDAADQEVQRQAAEAAARQAQLEAEERKQREAQEKAQREAEERAAAEATAQLRAAEQAEYERLAAAQAEAERRAGELRQQNQPPPAPQPSPMPPPAPQPSPMPQPQPQPSPMPQPVPVQPGAGYTGCRAYVGALT
ncbi:thermonuclease family protein [Ornithinimicrobium sp. Y1847]|uniref:thermonuclease family protein n=1 Tax=Ornithinimicrobium sp. Y1847 TaxID=3405419 RepID=UPI003B6713F9